MKGKSGRRQSGAATNRVWEAAKRMNVIVTHGADDMAGTRQNDGGSSFPAGKSKEYQGN